MNRSDANVLVIGGGIAGLAAADELAGLGIEVDLIEKKSFLGGHATFFTCKAADTCVSCGACMVDDRLAKIRNNNKIRVHTATSVNKVSRNGRFNVKIDKSPGFIDEKLCTSCGVCLDLCPEKGALIQSLSAAHLSPQFAVSTDKCRYFADSSCRECETGCPEKAITLDKKNKSQTIDGDAIVMATGFHHFDSVNRPYGYDHFDNVITNLDLETMLRSSHVPKRVSDQKQAKEIGFIQCVGSRDVNSGHLWCSKICCAAALRMARLIKTRNADTKITFFYIDIQTFGTDFNAYYKQAQKDFRFIRAIPADIDQTDNGSLTVSYFNPVSKSAEKSVFDLMILSAGIEPAPDIDELAARFDLKQAETRFLESPDLESKNLDTKNGIFSAGTVTGPMGIKESVASAGNAVFALLNYIDQIKKGE